MPGATDHHFTEKIAGALCTWLPKQRWFAGKSRQIVSTTIAEKTTVGTAQLWEIAVSFAEGAAEHYVLPTGANSEGIPPEAVIAPDLEDSPLVDSVHDPAFRQFLFQILATPPCTPGALSATRGKCFATLFPQAAGAPGSRVLPVEQSNTSLIYGERLFVKFYRRRVHGPNPDAELTRYLSEVAGFRHIPAFAGEIRWDDASLALATELSPNQGDGWARALREFQRWLQDEQALVPWLQAVSLLGRRTGQMHLALANPHFHKGEWTDFAAEAMSPQEMEERRNQSLQRFKDLCLAFKRDRNLDEMHFSPSEVSRALGGLASGEQYLIRRTHGDYHLGQVLCADDDFLIIDFEGEPSRSLAERRAKHPPIRDVAGMFRSFHYAAHAARDRSPGAATIQQAEMWARASQRAFLTGWRETVQDTPVADERLLAFYMAEKALYEWEYERNNRPDWVHIPLRGLNMELPS